jgi:hypothetical protein
VTPDGRGVWRFDAWTLELALATGEEAHGSFGNIQPDWLRTFSKV